MPQVGTKSDKSPETAIFSDFKLFSGLLKGSLSLFTRREIAVFGLNLALENRQKTGNSNARVTIPGKEKGRRSVPEIALRPALAPEASLPGLVVVLVDLARRKLVPRALPGLEGFRDVLYLLVAGRPDAALVAVPAYARAYRHLSS